MASWTLETLRELDLLYAEQGIHPHQRSFRAARDILREGFVIGVGGNPEVDRIMAAYDAMMPEAKTNWPGMGTGIAAVVDQVRRITAPVIFGTVSLSAWKGLGFDSEGEWWRWCREDQQFASRTLFAFADVLDLTYGFDELKKGGRQGVLLWQMAASNVSDFSNILPRTFSVESVIQPICLAVELSLKAVLVDGGADPASFRKRGGEGHDLVRLAERVATDFPHRDDSQAREIAAAMPTYVDSRYAPAGLSRLHVVRLALGAQFIAASAVRRRSRCDLAAKMEQGGWPAPRLSPLS
jgi:hypothetical protein